MIKTGGGFFDPNERNLYFLATNVDMHRAISYVPHHLIALNEVDDGDMEEVVSWAGGGNCLFLDSGVYNLAMNHARAHGISMDDALSVPPQEIDGFDALFAKYIGFVKKWESVLWGYIEIDLGGRENKLKTRALLEAEGLRPIPVYHPMNDGWEYFDYLAENYDRICFGNIVHAKGNVRKRLISTMWERHEKYPDLWIHLLGLTPNQHMNAYPADSADSSAWTGVRRWQGYVEKAMGASLGPMHKNWKYVLGESDTESGYLRADRMSGYGAMLGERNWRNHLAAMKREGMIPYGDPR